MFKNTNYPLNEDQLAQKNAVAGLSQQLKSFGTDTPKPATSSTTAAKKNATLELYAVAGTSKESASSLSARLDRVEKDLGVFSSEVSGSPLMYWKTPEYNKIACKTRVCFFFW